MAATGGMRGNCWIWLSKKWGRGEKMLALLKAFWFSNVPVFKPQQHFNRRQAILTMKEISKSLSELCRANAHNLVPKNLYKTVFLFWLSVYDKFQRISSKWRVAFFSDRSCLIHEMISLNDNFLSKRFLIRVPIQNIWLSIPPWWVTWLILTRSATGLGDALINNSDLIITDLLGEYFFIWDKLYCKRIKMEWYDLYLIKNEVFDRSIF